MHTGEKVGIEDVVPRRLHDHVLIALLRVRLLGVDSDGIGVHFGNEALLEIGGRRREALAVAAAKPVYARKRETIGDRRAFGGADGGGDNSHGRSVSGKKSPII